MVERETVPTSYRDCNISVVTEKMADGRWGVVATVTHSTEGAVKVIPVPLPAETFGSEADAREFAVRAAKTWIDENTPTA